jgi:hypothetical protein
MGFIKKVINRFLITAGVGAALLGLFSIPYCCETVRNNGSKIVGNKNELKTTIQKARYPFGSTELVRTYSESGSKDALKIHYAFGGDYTFIDDNDGSLDGVVDELYFEEGNREIRLLKRGEDYTSFKKEFDSADKKLAEARQMFAKPLREGDEMARKIYKPKEPVAVEADYK